jgi:hypothetical protein
MVATPSEAVSTTVGTLTSLAAMGERTLERNPQLRQGLENFVITMRQEGSEPGSLTDGEEQVYQRYMASLEEVLLLPNERLSALAMRGRQETIPERKMAVGFLTAVRVLMNPGLATSLGAAN